MYAMDDVLLVRGDVMKRGHWFMKISKSILLYIACESAIKNAPVVNFFDK